MKKILAILLALCLVLSLSLTAFAADKSPELSPELPPAPVNPGAAGGSAAGGANSSTTGKYVYKVTTASGAPLTADIQAVNSGDIYDEIKGAGVVVMYYITITSSVNPDEIVNIDVYAPGVTSDCDVLIYDEWELGSNLGVSFAANGNRATITGPAGAFNTWHYVAIVSDAAKVVEVPQEGTNQDEEGEDVNETPVVDVEPEDNTPAPAPSANDANPGTGIALAVVPMIVAAAAVVVSKKR